MCVCFGSVRVQYVSDAELTECSDPLPSPLKGATRLLTENVSLHACTNMHRDTLALTRTDGQACILPVPCLEVCAHTPAPSAHALALAHTRTHTQAA